MGKNPIWALEAYLAEMPSAGDDISQCRRGRAARAGGPDPNPQPGSQPPVDKPPPFPDDEPPHDEPHEDPPPPVRHRPKTWNYVARSSGRIICEPGSLRRTG